MSITFFKNFMSGLDSSQPHTANSAENSVFGHNWCDVNLWKFEWKTTAKTFLKHRLSTGRFFISTFIQEAPVLSCIQPLPNQQPFYAPVPARKKKAQLKTYVYTELSIWSF